MAHRSLVQFWARRWCYAIPAILLKVKLPERDQTNRWINTRQLNLFGIKDVALHAIR